MPELVDLGRKSGRQSGPLQEVEVASSEPPRAHRRTTDLVRLRDQDWRTQAVVGFKFTMAPVVRDWPGLSLLRLLSIYIGVTTGELAHDWIAATKDKTELGFAFATFVLGGFFLSVITGLGEKYIDKALTIIAAKLGVVLVNAPVPSILKERPNATAPTATD